MMNMQTVARRTYRSFTDEVATVTLLMSKQTAINTTVGSTARLGRKTTHDEELEKSRGALPKNLIRPLSYRIAKASGSRDQLSHFPVHADVRDGVDYGGDASSERWQNLDWFPSVCGDSRTRVYIGATWSMPTPESVTVAHYLGATRTD
jgi:hypothetical protein